MRIPGFPPVFPESAATVFPLFRIFKSSNRGKADFLSSTISSSSVASYRAVPGPAREGEEEEAVEEDLEEEEEEEEGPVPALRRRRLDRLFCSSGWLSGLGVLWRRRRRGRMVEEEEVPVYCVKGMRRVYEGLCWWVP